MPLNHTQYISVNNKQCMTQPTLINLHPNEYIQGLNYYLLAVNLGRYRGSSNVFNVLSNRVYVSKKVESFNLCV